METLQRVEKDMPLLLMSSQSNEEWIGNLKSIRRNPCIIKDNHLDSYGYQDICITVWKRAIIHSHSLAFKFKPRAQRVPQLPLGHRQV